MSIEVVFSHTDRAEAPRILDADFIGKHLCQEALMPGSRVFVQKLKERRFLLSHFLLSEVRELQLPDS